MRPEDRASKRILVVDDAVELAEAFELVLRAEGYGVAVAEDGRRGLELAATFRPDLIVLDMMMPEVDGLEFLARLPREIPLPLPRVVAVSGFDRLRPLALERGARAFVRKPVDLDELLSLIDSTLADEPIDERVVRAHDRAVDSARAAAAKARLDLWSSGVLRDPAMRADARRLLDVLAGYFALPKASFKVVLDDRLYLLAQSAGPERFHFPEDVPIDATLAFDSDVVRAGTSAVVEDATKHPAYADHFETQFGVRFWIAAPVKKAGLAVGTVCLIDTVPHEVRSEDLAVLGRFGERIGESIEAAERGVRLPPGVLESGLFDREAFELLTNAALRRIERDGGSVDVAVIELEGGETRLALDAVFGAMGRERLVVASIGPQTVAFAIDGKDAPAVRARLESGVDAIQRHGRVRSTGMTCSSAAPGCAPSVDAADLVRVIVNAAA